MKQKTIEILRNLVSFKSVTANDNAAIVSYIKSFLEKQGVTVSLFPSKSGNNSIVGTIGPEDKPSFIFSGHIDVVPPEEHSKHAGWWCHNLNVSETPEPALAWTGHPHVCEERDGRIYGRGTCDMLGAVASLLAFSQDINPEELKYKIVFSFTCDEETEMAAIGDIIDCEFADRNAPNFPIGCIVMEPTDMRPVVAHRGVVAGKFYVDGKISHVSRPDIMIDPVLPMLDILGHFRTVADAYVAKEGGDPLFIPPQSNYTIYTMRTHEQGRDTPHRAEFGYVFHYLPGNYPTQVLEEMDEYVEAANLKLKAKDSSCGAQHSVDFKLLPFSTEPTNPLLRHVFAASGHCTYDKVGFFTEAGYFHQAGIPVVIIGPGSILQAHVPDEFVEVNQLEKADSFLKHLHRDFLLK